MSLHRLVLVLGLAVILSHLTGPAALAQEAAPADTRRPTFSRYLWGVAASQIADNVSTQMAMSPYIDASGQLMARAEVNPLLPCNRGGNAIMQAVGTVASVILLRRLEPNHPKLARVLAIGLMGLAAQDTVHNLRHYRNDRIGR